MNPESSIARLSRIWSGEDPEAADVRDLALGQAVNSILHCRNTSRPLMSGPDKEYWDQCWLNRSLSLEMFLCPKDAIRLFAVNQQAKIQEYRELNPDKKIPPLVAKILHVKRQGELLKKPDAEDGSYLDCVLEMPLDSGFLPEKFLETANASLHKHGLPDELLLFESSELGLSHVANIVFMNPCIAGESGTNSSFVPPDQRYPTILSWEEDPSHPLKGDLCTDFVASGPASDLQIPETYRFQNLLQEAGFGDHTLHDLLYDEKLKENEDLYDAVLSAVHTVYMNHKMGISRLEPSSNALGHFVTRERYGRLALDLEGDNQDPVGGLLLDCKCMLRFAKTPKGLRQMGTLSWQSSRFWKQEKDSENPEIPEFRDPDTGKPTDFAREILQCSPAGTFCSSVIRGTSADLGRDSKLWQSVQKRKEPEKRRASHLRLV